MRRVPNFPPFALLVLSLAAGCAGENVTEPALDPYDPGPGEPPACLPNLDGRIDEGELPTALGLPLSFRVTPAGEERSVDLVGLQQGNTILWDLSATAEPDEVFTLAAAPLEGHWFAASFPGGQFVLPVDPAGTVLAVHSRADGAIRLHGVASAVEQPPAGKTLLPYEEPIDLYRFPIEPGAAWVQTGYVSDGTWNGVPYAGWDEYEVSVDARGTLALPELSFTEAHRVRTNLTVQPAYGFPSSRRLVSWMFECFGEVARAQSRLDETEEDFTVATEVRRLGILPPE